MNKSKGLIVCGIFSIFFGLTNLGLFIVMAFRTKSIAFDIDWIALLAQHKVSLFVALVFAFSGFFLMRCFKWSRWALIIFSGYYIYSFAGPTFSYIRAIIDHYGKFDITLFFIFSLFNIALIAILSGLIFYLFLPRVREQFK